MKINFLASSSVTSECPEAPSVKRSRTTEDIHLGRQNVVPGPNYFHIIVVVPVKFRIDLKFTGIATALQTDSET